MAGPGIMLVHSSAEYEGFMCGDPIADDEVLWTDAPDSEDADSCGGIWSIGETVGL